MAVYGSPLLEDAASVHVVMISEAAKFGGEAVVPDKSETATCVM